MTTLTPVTDTWYINGTLAEAHKPRCLLGDHEVGLDAVQVPWGSNYEAELICPACFAKHFDKVIAKILAEKGNGKDHLDE